MKYDLNYQKLDLSNWLELGRLRPSFYVNKFKPIAVFLDWCITIPRFFFFETALCMLYLHANIPQCPVDRKAFC